MLITPGPARHPARIQVQLIALLIVVLTLAGCGRELIC